MAKRFKPLTDEEWMKHISLIVSTWEEEDSEETAEGALTAVAEVVLQWVVLRLRDKPHPGRGEGL
jgi:hypothetical protein